MAGERAVTARGAARRTALLDAAIEVVAEGGSASLTHRAVAARVPASLASVTYHFASIDDLRRAMFEHAGHIVTDQLNDTVATAMVQRLPEVTADFLVRLITEYRNPVVAMHQMIVAAAYDANLQPTFHVFQRRLGDLLAPCVGGQAAGLTAAATLQGLLLSALTYPDLDVEQFRSSVVELIGRLRVTAQLARP
ncbi:TetR/AcrR family transcriptional regulator [Actinoplanes sp. RD1]|uniref:TetR/AcrR family transcriptional regulator n=1 Tax=Actinoplanes sp. RD1 TaxID=3064538 RepID=UPI0027413E14|nr:TetR family transcriptional regulator [Actinoplanes sp. RD1]